jgi:hypothetical protein
MEFRNQETHRYQEFTNPYSGMAVYLPDGLYQSQTRFSLYRWHIADPIRFSYSLRSPSRRWAGEAVNAICHWQMKSPSVAFWYQRCRQRNFRLCPNGIFWKLSE